MSEKLAKVYYYAGTHWDREWHQPFQGFRIMLVERIDEILSVLEKNPDFAVFHFDGQTILLDDYCRIRPGSKEQLSSLLRTGRIIAGPWYTMPDELLVSGESLVRNLITGHALAREYGVEPMKYGYLCDVFGHAAQMPQILRGVGIDGALFGRGTNSHRDPAHFLWEAPDGSRVTTFKVPESTGYASFWKDVYFDNKGRGPEDHLSSALAYVASEEKRSSVPLVLLMDSMDHEKIHPEAPQLARELSQALGCPVVFESLEKFCAEAERYRDRMPVRRGELLDTAKEITNHHMLIPHTLSSRYDIKRANDRCQTLYEKWLLPLLAKAHAEGRPLPPAYAELGYRYLLQCHAHDSICGCSIDSVHQDMHYRFRQARDIGSRLMSDLLLREVGEAPATDASSRRILCVYNPLPFQRREVIEADVAFPTDYPQRYSEYKRFEQRNAFRLFDHAGSEVPYNLLDVRRGTFHKEIDERSRSVADVHRIAFLAELPPMGAAEYIIEPSSTPVRHLGGIASTGATAENEHLRLALHIDGTLELTDKRTQKSYPSLCSYLDSGEIGDGWHHVEPTAGYTTLSLGAPTTISLVNDGPVGCTYQVVHRLEVPSALLREPGHIQRSSRTGELKIVTRFTLGTASPYVDVETTVYNTLDDHRLQLRLPTGIAEDTYYADQAFCFVQRPTGLDRETGSWYERAVVEKPFESIVYKRDSSGAGLAFLSAHGLHECAALDDADGTLLITLFRSFSKTHLTDGEPDGQLKQALHFRYRLMPLTPSDDYDVLLQARDCLQTGQKALCRPAGGDERVAKQPGWLEVSGPGVAATVIKPAENGSPGQIIVRIVNYTDRATEATVTPLSTILSARTANLLEEPEAPLPVRGNSTVIPLGPWQIKTCLIDLATTP